MLPFTKRPGRSGDENGAGGDSKDNAPASKAAPASHAPQQPVVRRSTRSAAPPSSRDARPAPAPEPATNKPRLFQPSISDEEMTTLMPSKSAAAAIAALKSPPPAAGRPASAPPPAMMRAPEPSVDEEGDDGRTQIRAPMAGRVLVPNSTISAGGIDEDDQDERTVGLASPAAHPADAPEPTRAMAGAPIPGAPGPGGTNRPPAHTLGLEPSVEVAHSLNTPTPAHSHPLMLGNGKPRVHQSQPPTAAMMQPQPMGFAPQHAQPMVAHLSGAYPHQVGMPAPMMSQPAHFAVPHAAPSEARMDPPATVLTQSNRGSGNRTASWAAALMVVGLCCGLVAAFVASGGSDSLADTSASFVDPSRPGHRAAAAPADPAVTPVSQPAAQPAIAAVAPSGAVAPPSVFPVVTNGNTAAPGEPAGQPLVNTGVATPAAQPAAADPVAVAQPQPVAAPPPAAAPQPVAASQPKSVAAAQPVAVAQPRPVAAPAAAPAPRPRPAPADDAVAAAPAPKPVKAAPAAPAPKPAKAGKGGEDDELKKAADALSKAQLENSL